jgi:DNA-binding transcriptional ArsR family regulator
MAARPATRRPPAPPTAPAARPPVRDFTGGAPFAIEWDVRTAYDFLFSLSGDAGSTDDLPETDRAWLTDARSSLPKDLQQSVSTLFDTEVAIHTVPLVVGRPEVRTAADFVAALADVSPADVVRAIISNFNDSPAVDDLLARLEQGDTSAIAEIEECLPEHKRGAQMAIVRDRDGAYAQIMAVLDAWQKRFVEIEDRVKVMLDRDYDLRSDDRRTLVGSELIERTTGGIRWLPEPGVRRIILAPSYFTRPYNFIFSGQDWRFFGYPIADESLDDVDPLAPPQAVIRLHRALGDDTRLRILKLLAGRDLYLTEIAQQLELSKPTIKHHLALLRAAGLVTITESGTVVYYSLRREPLEAASLDLKSFLVGPSTTGAKRPD